MTTSTRVFSVLLFAGLVSSSRPAASLTWRAIGPGGENVYALALDPTNSKIVFAGSRIGLYRSTDGGITWASGAGLEKASILSVAVDPKNPKTVYAGAFGGGVYRSTDGGVTFKYPTAPAKGGLAGFSANEIPRGNPVHSIAIDPSNPKRIFAGGLYETGDGGLNWKKVSATYGGGISDVQSLAFDPKNPKTLYSADTGTLHRSNDGGATWSRLSTGLGEPANLEVVAIDPKDSKTLYVGSKHKSLRRSNDGGATWKAPSSGIDEKADITAIAVDPVDTKTVYVAASLHPPHEEGSIFRSTDGGDTFEDIGESFPIALLKALVVDPSNPKTVYAGTDSGVFKTTDGGKSWSESNAGFAGHHRRVHSVAAVAGSPRAIFVSAFEGLYRSTDEGKTWQRLHTGADKQSDFHLIAVSPDDPSLVIAADDSEIPARSTDRGDTWKIVYGGPYLTCLTSVPGESRSFVGCEKEGGLIRTANGGESWKKMGPEDLNTTFSSFVFDPTSRENMIATVRGGGLMRSTNGGKKWKEFNKGVTIKKESFSSFGEYYKMFALTPDPSSPKSYVAATQEDGVFRTTDGGETWRNLGLTDQKLTAFALDPTNPKRMVAGTQDKGVFVTTDGGATWQAANAGLSEDGLRITSVSIDRGSPAHIVVGTYDAGAFLSE